MDDGNPVISLLLYQFRCKAHAKAEQADLQVLGAQNCDPEWESLLRGLSAASEYALPAAIDVMLSWRKAGIAAANQQDKQTPQSTLMVLRKRLSIEAIFLEATLAVLQRPGGPVVLSERQGSTLEGFAFDWIVNAERYIEPRFTELITCRSMVVESCAQILGALSPTRLHTIVARFLKDVSETTPPAKVSRLKSESPAARLEILQLCRGMRHMRIPVTTDMQVRQAVAVIEKLSPLQFSATKSKAQVHNAVAHMLAAILAHCVARDEPRSITAGIDVASMAIWYNCMTAMRAALSTWIAKSSKYAATAVPLKAQLLCLARDSEYLRDVGPLMDTLQKLLRGDYSRLLAALNPLGETEKKLLRDQSVRTSAVACLRQCIATYLRRFALSTPAVEVHRWLHKALSSIVVQLCRSSFPLSEQQMAIKGMMVDVGKHEPVLVIELVTKHMLGDPCNMEMVAIGLSSLLEVILSPHAQPESKESTDDGSLERERLLNFMRNGIGVLEPLAAEHLQAVCAAKLGKFMEISRAQTGFCASTVVASTKVVSEAVAKEKLAGVDAAWRAALRCIPFVMPRQWLISPGLMAEELASLTIHTDPLIREESAAAVLRVMMAQPLVRGPLLAGLTSAYAALPDDSSQVVYKVAMLMVDFMAVWRDMVVRDASSFPLPAGDVFEVALVEGYALSIMCSSSINVRQAGIQLLHSARTLHRALCNEADQDEHDIGGIMASSAHMPASPPTTALMSPSGTPRTPLAVQAALDSPRAYVADIVQHAGDACSLACYWNTNTWAYVRQLAFPSQPADTSFQAVLTASGQSEQRRAKWWARTLAEVVKAARKSCTASCIHACSFVARRLPNLVSKEYGGRCIPAGEAIFDPGQLQLARCFCAVIMAAPPVNGSSYVMGTRDVMHLLVSTVRACQEPQLSIAIEALGCCQPGNYTALAEQLQTFRDDGTIDRKSFKSRQRHMELKLAVAQVVQGVLHGARPGVLCQESPFRSTVMMCISDVCRILPNSTAEVTPETQQLRVCLAQLVTVTAQDLGQLAPQDFSTSTRRQLFELLLEWTPPPENDGARLGTYWGEVQRGFATSTARLREPDAQRAAEADLAASVPLVEMAAHSAMAALMLGPSIDKETKALKGKPIEWVHSLLVNRPTSLQVATLPTSTRLALAIKALSNLLKSCPGDLALPFVDKCYSADVAEASVYFQAVMEMWLMHDIPIKTHVLLALLLYKIVDQKQAMREGALVMLSTLSKRVWGSNPGVWAVTSPGALSASSPPDGKGGGGGGGNDVDQTLQPPLVGTLQESYHAYQLQLSARLAREHPEMTELVVIEVMTRQLSSCAPAHQHAMLSALAPWMENLSFAARWEGNWSEGLLKAMYFVTQQHAAAFPTQVERLWSTVARNRRNIVPILDFLLAHAFSDSTVGLGIQGPDPHQQLSVARRIVLWLARTAADLTIDHLLSEAARLIFEDDGGGNTAGSTECTGPPPPLLMLPAGSGGSSYAAMLPRGTAPEFSDQPSWPANAAAIAENVDWPDPPLATPGRDQAGHAMSRASSTASVRKHLASMPSGASAVAAYLERESGSVRAALTPQASLKGIMARDADAETPLSARSSHKQWPRTPAALTVGSPAATTPGEAATPAKHFTRPEVATALVAEAALEHQEAARRHAPLLAHIAVLACDDVAPTLGPPLLTTLLSALTIQQLQLLRLSGAMTSEHDVASGLLGQLQDMTPHPMWPKEDPSIDCLQPASAASLTALVHALLVSLCFEDRLRERWAAHALHWATTARSRHFASRSHQVYRALAPPLNQQAGRCLLDCLQECLAHLSTASQLAAADVLLTLAAAVEATPAEDLILYPHLFLAALAALDLPVVAVHSAALTLFSKLLQRLDTTDPAVCSVMEACAAMAATGGQGRVLQRSSSVSRLWPLGANILVARPDSTALAAAQQLLIKGLFQPPTHVQTLEVLSQLAYSVAAGLRKARAAAAVASGPLCIQQLAALPMSTTAQAAALFGDPITQTAVSLMSALPFILPYLQTSSPATACLVAHVTATAALDQTDLAATLEQLLTSQPLDSAAAAQLLAEPLSTAYFPRYAKMAMQRLMEVLQKGPLPTKQAALELLHALFTVPGARLGVPRLYTQALLAPLAQLLSSSLSGLANQAIEAMMAYYSTAVRGAQAAPDDPAHVSQLPFRGDTLPAAAAARAQMPQVDWPSACAPASAEPAAAVQAVARVATTCTADVRSSGSSSDGGIEHPGIVPLVYRTLGRRSSSNLSAA